VDAEDRRSALEREHVRGDRPGQALGHVAAGDPPEEALARRADHDRAPERDDLVQPAQQLEVVLERLAEADAGVEQIRSSATPAATAKASRSSRNALTSETTSS
jgi:hypothetical protein